MEMLYLARFGLENDDDDNAPGARGVPEVDDTRDRYACASERFMA